MSRDFQAKMHSKATTAIKYLESSLVGRNQEIRLILLAALAKHHSLLIGKPGTAKSLLAERLKDVLDLSAWSNGEPRYFQLLMMRFTKPDEIFGPLDVSQLLDSKYHRLTTGYLPGAQLAFLDEIFKANSAILNSLLMILNERRFNNGSVVEGDLPLISVVGASNELPRQNSADSSSDALTALYDRFLVRQWVDNLPKSQAPHLFRAYLPTGFDPNLVALVPPAEYVAPRIDRISSVEIDQAKKEAKHVLIPLPVLHMLLTLRVSFHELGIQTVSSKGSSDDSHSSKPVFYVSDRRWKWIIEFLQIAAWYDNRQHVSFDDLALLPSLVACSKDDVVEVRKLCGDFRNLFDSEAYGGSNVLNLLSNTIQEEATLAKKNQAEDYHLSSDQAAKISAAITGFQQLENWSDIISKKNDTSPSMWVTQELFQQTFTTNKLKHQKANLEEVTNVLSPDSPLQSDIKALAPLIDKPPIIEDDEINVVTSLSSLPITLDIEGMTFLLVEPYDYSDLDGWPNDRVSAPFYLSKTMVSREFWNSEFGKSTSEDHFKIAHPESPERIKDFLAQLSPRISQLGFGQPSIPTIGQWSLALRRVLDSLGGEDPVSQLKSKTNCQDHPAKLEGMLCNDSLFQHTDKLTFQSLLGGHWQLCHHDDSWVFVGGSNATNFKTCIDSPINPKPDETFRWSQSGFRIAIPAS